MQYPDAAPGYPPASSGYPPAPYAGASNGPAKPAPRIRGQAAINGQDEFNDPSGKYQLVMQGAYAAVECALTPGDLVKAESGAMVTMSSNVTLTAKLEGSVGGACFRSCCAGESMFMSYFGLQEGGGTRGDVLLAPAVPGDIILLHLHDAREWAIQKSSYMASDTGISIGVKTQGAAAGCCSGEGFFILKAKGTGRLLLNSYGGVMRYDLQPGEVRKIDNGFLVAWHSDMPYTISKASSSLVQSFLSGEGFVCTFTGPGTIYVQTRSLINLAHALAPHMPAQAAGGGGGGDAGI